MSEAKASITWYLATLAVTRSHLRNAITETENLMCIRKGKPVALFELEDQYPPGTEIRWVPIKKIEQGRREVMRWVQALCRVVGFKV